MSKLRYEKVAKTEAIYIGYICEIWVRGARMLRCIKVEVCFQSVTCLLSYLETERCEVRYVETVAFPATCMRSRTHSHVN